MSLFNRFFSRNRRYNDISVSIQEHLDERIDELMAEGMSRREAERTARRDFGNVTLLRERSREVWQWQRLESLLADLRSILTAQCATRVREVAAQMTKPADSAAKAADILEDAARLGRVS